jgi:hypothetical protein
MGATTKGVAVVTPHFLTIWPLKGMDTVVALVPSPLPEAEPSPFPVQIGERTQ